MSDRKGPGLQRVTKLSWNLVLKEQEKLGGLTGWTVLEGRPMYVSVMGHMVRVSESAIFFLPCEKRLSGMYDFLLLS